LRNIWN